MINIGIDEINWNVDQLILGHVRGTGEIAVYGVAAQINSLFLSFSTAISSVFSPRINRIAAQINADYRPVSDSRKSVAMHPNRKKYLEGLKRGEHFDVLCRYVRKSFLQRVICVIQYMCVRFTAKYGK